MSWRSHGNWRPYVTVAERRLQAARLVAKMKKAGRKVAPVEIEGRKIARTFWGDAWCKNLEAYSDYENRLPRGRTYVRNGSVIDLRIEAGRVRSLVSGSEIYEVEITIKPLAKKRWTDLKGRCSGRIDSLVELLKGSISKGVMEIVTSKGKGLFPSPREIELTCSCPDWAVMCKHVAATLYGVGARLDHRPELLFTLRGVDPAELVEAAVDGAPPGRKPRRGRVLEADDLSSVFGVDIDMGETASESAGRRAPKRKTAKKNTAGSAGRSKPSARSRKTAASKTTTKKTTKKKTTTKRAAKKKVVAKKSAVKKKAPKKAATRKAAAKKTSTKKAATRKSAAKKVSAKKAATRKTTAKKVPAKKAATRKSSSKTSTRKTAAK